MLKFVSSGFPHLKEKKTIYLIRLISHCCSLVDTFSKFVTRVLLEQNIKHNF